MTLLASRAYYDAWTTAKDLRRCASSWLEAFAFDSAMMHIEGREQFLAGAGAMAGRSGGHDPARRGLRWRAPRSTVPPTEKVKIVEHLIIRDGHIELSEVVVDGAAREFMTG